LSSTKPDFGSPNLTNHCTLRPEFLGKGHSLRLKVIDQNILDKLLNDEVVSIDQYMVIDRLASDYYKANLSGVKASSYSPRANSAAKTEPTNKEFMQRKKISGCLAEVRHGAGEKLSKVLMNILDDKPLSKEQMKDLWNDGVEKIVSSINKFYKEWER
jgi:hypothetical protein